VVLPTLNISPGIVIALIIESHKDCAPLNGDGADLLRQNVEWAE
jgi:hypothetical protein